MMNQAFQAARHHMDEFEQKARALERWTFAVRTGNLKEMKYCLEFDKTDIDVPLNYANALIQSINETSNTALKVIKFLLENGADVNRYDPKGFAYTPLSYALKIKAPIEYVSCLLEHGADPNQRCSTGTPLQTICGDGFTVSKYQANYLASAIDLLAKAGANVNGISAEGPGVNLTDPLTSLVYKQYRAFASIPEKGRLQKLEFCEKPIMILLSYGAFYFPRVTAFSYALESTMLYFRQLRMFKILLRVKTIPRIGKKSKLNLLPIEVFRELKQMFLANRTYLAS